MAVLAGATGDRSLLRASERRALCAQGLRGPPPAAPVLLWHRTPLGLPTRRIRVLQHVRHTKGKQSEGSHWVNEQLVNKMVVLFIHTLPLRILSHLTLFKHIMHLCIVCNEYRLGSPEGEQGLVQLFKVKKLTKEGLPWRRQAPWVPLCHRENLLNICIICKNFMLKMQNICSMCKKYANKYAEYAEKMQTNILNM